MPGPLPQPTPLLDLIRFLGLDQAYNVELPPDDFVGPRQEPPPLTGWAAAFDTGLDAVVGTFKGLTGLGDQGPAGPTWTNAAATLGAALPALPMLKKLPRFAQALENYRTPTLPGGQLSAPFYSRLEEAAAALPKQTFGPRVLSTVQKGEAAAEELALRGVPEFVAAAGNKPIQRAALEAHLAEHPLPQLEVTTLGGADHTQALEKVRAEMAAEQPGVAAAFKDAFTDTPHIEPMQRSEIVELYKRAQAGDQRAAEAFASWNLAPANEAAVAEYVERKTALDALLAEADRLKTTRLPKFEQWQLPGGENYKETLITIPPERPPFEAWVEQTQGRKPESFNSAALERLKKQYRNTPNEEFTTGNEYRSSHFAEPNILVHTRTNERELPGLGRGLFLEEVQSDWHQLGKKVGYGDSPPELAPGYKMERIDAEAAEMLDAEVGDWQVLDADGNDFGPPIPGHLNETEALATFVRDADAVGAGGIVRHGVRGIRAPDAPFKETWPDLALKHHIAEAAADPNVHWLGFTEGTTQNARYKLSNHVTEIEWHPQSLTFNGATEAGGRGVIINTPRGLVRFDLAPNGTVIKLGANAKDEWLGKPLDTIIGKEAAKRIMAADRGSLKGEGLEIGGEGMREFYDKLLPKRLEKIVKPYGGSVERVPLAEDTIDALEEAIEEVHQAQLSPEETRRQLDALRAQLKLAEDGTHAWILKLSPELKERILKYGLPLMAGVAAVNTGKEK